jgi:thiol-disulfide isomerase/thioredoxin
MINLKKTILLVALLILVGAGCNSNVIEDSNVSEVVDDSIVSENVEKESKVETFGQIPDLVLEDFDGEEVSLRSFVGTPMVINSWATWCPFCKTELPEFAQVQREFGDQVKFIAIDRSETLSVQKEYTDGMGITNDILFLIDLKDSFYRSVGGFSMPETLFVNRGGEIVVHKRGPLTLEQTRELVKQIIQ